MCYLITRLFYDTTEASHIEEIAIIITFGRLSLSQFNEDLLMNSQLKIWNI